MRTIPHHRSTTAATTGARSPGVGPAAAPPSTLGAGWPGQAILDSPATARVLHAAWSGDPAVIVPSPPGAGKTRLVTLLAAALTHRADLRVGIAAQTREQATELARRLHRLTPRAKLIWSASAPPPHGAGPVVSGTAVAFPRDHGGILVATTARWIFADPQTLGCDLMIVDEAWQATYADLGALGAFAGQVVCVGDPGQIDPVVTGSTSRWAGNQHGPHLPGPGALRAAHGDAIGVVALRETWRLGPVTTALIQPAFYPGLPFTSRRPPEHLTGPTGAPLPEIAHHLVPVTAGPGDQDLITACAQRARDLLACTYVTPAVTRPLSPGDLAVVCPHVSQAAAMRAMLADLPDVLVGTANQLQGLERAAVVVLHPLAGYRDAAAFTTDTGRACVMLSRHRAHATVVIDAHTPATLDAADPDLPSTVTHRALLDALLAAPAT